MMKVCMKGKSMKLRNRSMRAEFIVPKSVCTCLMKFYWYLKLVVSIGVELSGTFATNPGSVGSAG